MLLLFFDNGGDDFLPVVVDLDDDDNDDDVDDVDVDLDFCVDVVDNFP